MSEYIKTYETGQYESMPASISAVMRSVYGWMFGALAITGLVAWIAANSFSLTQIINGENSVYVLLAAAEVILVLALTAAINKLSALTATVMFIFYSILNGLTLSSIFLVYELGSIYSTAFITAGMFGAMALYGTTTKTDLSKFSSIMAMGLIGLLIALFVTFFLRNTVLDLIISVVGVALFTGITAWDTQKIKTMIVSANESGYSDNETVGKIAIIGALSLYLDFVNLFLYLLRIFGKKR